MKTLNIMLSNLSGRVIPIGYEGENLYTRIRINCIEVFSEYPDATVSMVVSPPVGDMYPAVVEKSGVMVVWDITDSVLSSNGSGECQLTFTEGDVVRKSVVFGISINRSLIASGEAPEPVQEWIDKAEQTAQEIAENAAMLAKQDIVESYGEIAPAIIETASGAIASFSDGADGMLVKTLTVDIAPVQDLHGYDHPWPGGATKNLFPYPKINGSGTILTKQPAKIPAGSYIVSCVRDQTNQNYISFTFYDENDSSCGSTTLYMANNNAVALTLTADAVTVTAYANATVSISNIQIEAGSSASSYIPYENSCQISGWESANVTGTGKNLLPVKFYTGFGYNDTVGQVKTLVADESVTKNGNVFSKTVSSWGGTGMVSEKLKPGTYKCNIAVSADTAENTRSSLYVFDENFKIIRRISNLQTSRTWTDTITISEGEAYIAVNVSSTSTGTVTITSPQIEIGSTESTYEAFSGETIEYEFPEAAGTVYGGTLTIHQDGSGELVGENGEVDLGTLNYTKSSAYFYADAPSDSAPVISNGQPFICEIYKRYVGPLSSMPDFTAGLNNVAFSGTKIFYCKDSRFDNASDFKTAMSGVKLVYPLETPVTYQLTNQQVIALLKGSNNIWADTGDVAVEYPADTKLYIDGKVAELQALILENISNS